MQKHVNLVDLVKSFPTNIYLQNLASIQKRTSPVKFAHLAEKSGKGSISNLSTKVFKLSLTCPKEYPMKPPKVKFISKIWHPNVGGNGDICLDVLQNMWSPALNLEQLILSIASLLTDPNPDSPMNGEAASLFKKSRDQYDA